MCFNQTLFIVFLESSLAIRCVATCVEMIRDYLVHLSLNKTRLNSYLELRLLNDWIGLGSMESKALSRSHTFGPVTSSAVVLGHDPIISCEARPVL